MAKWVINTTEDFVTVEADAIVIQEDGILTAYRDTHPASNGVMVPYGIAAGWSKGFWLSFHRQEEET